MLLPGKRLMMQWPILKAAKMRVEAAKANVSAVETNLRYATIYAPFSGIIGISQVKLGSCSYTGINHTELLFLQKQH
jgi:multidrug resistance efflux pump